MTEQGRMLSTFLDTTDCHIFLDIGASKSFMAKSYYLTNKSLHDLPTFSSKIRIIEVGNDQFCSVLVIIPVRMSIHSCISEIYTLAQEHMMGLT